ncbi:MAG: arylsulfatase [Verrucomicrobiaceae bacterium]|nr:arylsulfatase [Verrucomicrobiaceae bacterium]
MKMISKGVLCFLITLATFLADTTQGADRPNIILIFVDDLGYGDLGCYGNDKIRTPFLDRMAREGQRWTSFYSSGATCVPSRTGLMSGRHPVLLDGERLSTSREILMPAMLKSRGYATAILGKWHLAGYPRDFARSPMHPLECGFDYHFGTPGSNDVPAPPGKRQTREVFDTCDKFTFPVPLIRGREQVEFPVNQELLTKRYTEEAVKWIKERRDEPFFLYLAHNMPHAPIFASADFQGQSAGGRYGDVIEEIDWSVGQVMAAVRRADLEERTLIVFTSDNGPWTMFGPHGGTARPLRGEKGTTWEGGLRVPGIFHWPGRISPGVVHGMAANLDLYATFAALAGAVDLPSSRPGWKSSDLSGVLLRGEKSPRTQWLYGRSAFRSGKYKIHLTSRERSSHPDTRQREPVTKYDPPMLVDLEKDPGETTDLAARHPELVERLLMEMNLFREK